MNDRSLVINANDFDRLTELINSPQLRTTHAPLVMELEQELGRGRVVSPTGMPKGVVTMNSKVRFRDVRTGRLEIYTLVYPAEADIESAKLSVLSPLGIALFGANVGEAVECRTPGGVRRLKVERILIDARRCRRAGPRRARAAGA